MGEDQDGGLHFDFKCCGCGCCFCGGGGVDRYYKCECKFVRVWMGEREKGRGEMRYDGMCVSGLGLQCRLGRRKRGRSGLCPRGERKSDGGLYHMEWWLVMRCRELLF